MGSNLLPRYAVLVLRRPGLLGAALGAAWAFRRGDWYRRFPFLPLPSRRYLRWRLETAYGDPDATPTPGEFEGFLRWASRARRRARQDEIRV